MKNSEKFKKFEKERELVQHLKYDKHLNFRQIAKYCEKSIYWVASRLDDKYSPSTYQSEQEFKNEIIIPFLKSKKHEIIGNIFKISLEMKLFISLLSKKKDIIYFYEIKTKTNLPQLCFLIGKLQISSYIYKKSVPDAFIKLNIVLPKKLKTYKYFTKSFLEYLDDLNIKILFL